MDDLFDKVRAKASAFTSRYFDNFRFVEFSAAVGAAYAAGEGLAVGIHLTPEQGHYVGLFGALVGAVAYVRNPKRKGWQGDPVETPEVYPAGYKPGADADAES